MQLVLLIEINKTLIIENTQVALPLLFLFWIENSWAAVLFTV